MSFNEPPITPLPEGPPAPPHPPTPVPRQAIDDLLTALGYDPAWVNVVTITRRGVEVSVVAGELYPIVREIHHPYETTPR